MSFLAFDLIKETMALFSVAALARLSFQGVSMPPISLEECRIADVCWGPSSTLICAQQALYPQSHLSSPSTPSLEHVFCLLSNMVICPVGRSLYISWNPPLTRCRSEESLLLRGLLSSSSGHFLRGSCFTLLWSSLPVLAAFAPFLSLNILCSSVLLCCHQLSRGYLC